MLKSLNVKNFAIIEDLSVNFKEGMTVLTGETGAGKSLIIDTILLLLGARADSDMIRYGTTYASIEGVFNYKNEDINTLLDKYGIPKKEDITIYREIYETSKNVIKINNTSVSLTILKQISLHLADVHVQNDTFRLFNPDNYLNMINPKNDNKYDKLLNAYLLSYASYLEKLKKYNHILKGQKESIERLEFLMYEKEELSNLNLEKDLDKTLEVEISKLENYDKIFNNLNTAYESLNNEYFTIDNIYSAANNMSKISDYDESYKEHNEKLLDCYYILEEIINDISKQINSLDFDADELNLKIERLNDIEKAKAKYKMNLDELMEYLDKITLEIDMVNNYDEVLKDSLNDVIHEHKTLKEKAISLSDYRKQIALKIEKGIIKECKELDLQDIEFKVDFNNPNLDDHLNSSIFTETGIDEVNLLINFNKGEQLKSLHKVASGGEMSRIMLAFKAYFSKTNTLSLMVFDEIDTGVSGQTAKKIADKLYEISSNTQVLCITHLPHVAAIGDNHVHIYKESKNNRTYTNINYLNKEDRIKELALMLSGDTISLYALDHARSLIENKKS
jgi:DNA repair protein RecN (Recombination protein N)